MAVVILIVIVEFEWWCMLSLPWRFDNHLLLPWLVVETIGIIPLLIRGSCLWAAIKVMSSHSLYSFSLSLILERRWKKWSKWDGLLRLQHQIVKFCPKGCYFACFQADTWFHEYPWNKYDLEMDDFFCCVFYFCCHPPLYDFVHFHHDVFAKLCVLNAELIQNIRPKRQQVLRHWNWASKNNDRLHLNFTFEHKILFRQHIYALETLWTEVSHQHNDLAKLIIMTILATIPCVGKVYQIVKKLETRLLLEEFIHEIGIPESWTLDTAADFTTSTQKSNQSLNWEVKTWWTPLLCMNPYMRHRK